MTLGIILRSSVSSSSFSNSISYSRIDEREKEEGKE
jgi:hypothetical protein